ncbi:hypothetical protein AC578_4225 [Pseudocercospora eumusae]|uniref:Uncharacterized protein n=1 Tax=Pseudocercospora eumusae TaxID=321146 RepID=A0A139H3A0_9PEZI|nr:hypothetical protein AC578_4225 [Pseudocercospora eumusae]
MGDPRKSHLWPKPAGRENSDRLLETLYRRPLEIIQDHFITTLHQTGDDGRSWIHFAELGALNSSTPDLSPADDPTEWPSSNASKHISPQSDLRRCHALDPASPTGSRVETADPGKARMWTSRNSGLARPTVRAPTSQASTTRRPCGKALASIPENLRQLKTLRVQILM